MYQIMDILCYLIYRQQRLLLERGSLTTGFKNYRIIFARGMKHPAKFTKIKRKLRRTERRKGNLIQIQGRKLQKACPQFFPKELINLKTLKTRCFTVIQ